jgi:hypothetical protein
MFCLKLANSFWRASLQVATYKHEVLNSLSRKTGSVSYKKLITMTDNKYLPVYRT